MSRRKEIIIDGVAYESIKQASIKYKIKYNTIIDRLNRGWSIEKAFGLINNDRYCNNEPVTINGKKYRSKKQASREFNLNYNTVIARIRNGWSIEEAFEIKPRQKNKKVNSVTKVNKNTLVDICKKHNKKYDIVHRRIIRGWTLEEALELNLDNIGEVILHGRKFDSIREAAIAYRIPLMYIIKGLRKTNSIQEIFHIKNNESLIINGKKYETIEEALSTINISNKLYMQRIRKGWFIEEVISGKRICSGNRIINYDNKQFKNLKEMSEYYNLDYANFCTRLRRGWTFEEAINGKRNKKRR